MSVKSVYNMVLSYQIIQMFVFFYFFIENEMIVEIPIVINLYVTPAVKFNFDYTFQFDLISMMLFIAGIALVTILSGIQAVGSGLNDSATSTLRGLLSTIAMSFIMGFPTFYIFGLSIYLVPYAIVFNFFCFMVYVFNYLTKEER